MRRGFSLIEVLVALVIFEFGILALMAASAVAARNLGTANRRLRAQWLASDRVEELRPAACAAPAVSTGRAAAPGGLTEFWRVESVGSRRVISDSVDLPLPNGAHGNVVARAWLLCRD
jgi:prepilin-type N-terminal cleavage/methylation domain-containing protein